MAIADQFVQQIVSCNEYYAAGSILKVAALPDCANEPILKTLSNTGAASAGDEQITLTAATGEEVDLEKGSKLNFAAEVVTVTEDALVTDAGVLVNVEELTVGLADGDTVQTYGMLKILSPTSLPPQSSAETTDRTDLSFGLQSSEVKTAVGLTMSVGFISRPDDKGFWTIVHPADQSTVDIYALSVVGGEHIFGRAKVMNLSITAERKTILEGTFDLNFQPPFARTRPYEYLSASERQALNTLRANAGMSQLS